MLDFEGTLVIRPFAYRCMLCVSALLFLCGCKAAGSADSKAVEIAGRGSPSSPRQPIYRVKMPPAWQCSQSSLEDPLLDTTLPLCEFHIGEGDDAIRLTIHNFPTDTMEERIPPKAQISRWRRQFDDIDPSSVRIEPQAFSGFAGSVFEAAGTIKGQQAAMLGWSLQIGPEHYRKLSYPRPMYKQMRADVTIKVVGPSAQMAKHRKTILAFARTFELINEIPARS